MRTRCRFNTEGGRNIIYMYVRVKSIYYNRHFTNSERLFYEPENYIRARESSPRVWRHRAVPAAVPAPVAPAIDVSIIGALVYINIINICTYYNMHVRVYIYISNNVVITSIR